MIFPLQANPKRSQFLVLGQGQGQGQGCQKKLTAQPLFRKDQTVILFTSVTVDLYLFEKKLFWEPEPLKNTGAEAA